MFGQLASSTFISPIKESQVIKPSATGKKKRSIVASVMLTSLVDAFTIVVIYLIINSSASEQINVEDGLKLPQATFSKELELAPTVSFKNGYFIIDNQKVSENALATHLKQLVAKNSSTTSKNKDVSIIVQADENVDFDKLQPLLIASSYAGIKNVKFAVLQKD